MKHRFTIPSVLGAESVHEWLHGRGWHVVREELQYLLGGGVMLHVMIQPRLPREGAEPRSWEAAISVCSGATLIYDDVELSMGVTMLAEPRDAVPPEPEDAAPVSLTELFLDPSLVQERRAGRWRR